MKYKPMAEINVVPFIDVMLVLLVIFMFATREFFKRIYRVFHGKEMR